MMKQIKRIDVLLLYLFFAISKAIESDDKTGIRKARVRRICQRLIKLAERTTCERRRPHCDDYCVFNRLSSAERGVIPP